MEAWGRKKRSVAAAAMAANNSSGKQLGDDMTLSREIVVLDLKEKDPNAPASEGDDSSASPSQAGKQAAQKSPLKSAANRPVASSSGNQHHHHHNHHQQQEAASLESVDEFDTTRHCLSRQSIFVLFISIGFFFVLYMCVVACFFARRDSKISPIKHQFH